MRMSAKTVLLHSHLLNDLCSGVTSHKSVFKELFFLSPHDSADAVHVNTLRTRVVFTEARVYRHTSIQCMVVDVSWVLQF
jgi:hypothetical protein